CGIGPELVARVLIGGEAGRAVAVGDAGVMRRALRQVGCDWPLAVLDGPASLGHCPPRCLPLWQPAGLAAGLAELPMGRVDARAGAAAAVCIEAAVRAVLAGDAAAVVTAPVHKEALAAAGVP